VDQSGNTLAFTNSVTFPVGANTYTLKGTVPSAWANGETVQLNTTPSSWSNPQGQSSGNTITISTGNFTMNTMTVQGLSLNVAMAASPASQNIVAGGQNVLFANIQLDASASGDNIRINSVPVRLATGGASSLGFLSTCQLFDSNGNAVSTGSNAPTTMSSTTVNTFTLNNSITIPKGTQTALSLECNVASNAAGSYTFSTLNTDTMTIAGASTGNSTTATLATSNSGTMTVSAGNLTMGVDASSPSYVLAAGGTTGVTVGVYKFHPVAEAMTLQKIGVTIGGGATTADVSQVRFYSASNVLLGSLVFSGSTATATSTLQTTLNLPADQDTLVTVKADLSDIGVSQAGGEGDLIQINPSSAQAIGQSSGGTKLAGTTNTVAGVRAYNTFPTVALGTLPSTGMADGRLIHFSVTADSHGNVGIGTFSFKVSTSSPGLVQSVQLFGFTDSGYSTGISSGAANGGQIGNTLNGIPSNGTFTVTPNTSPVEVPAGSTYYFELRGAVTAGTNASVLTTLLGDTNGTPTTGTTAYSSVATNFVWSPNATGTAATSTGNDWTNGFGINGLPSGGIFQSRSQ
jgi:hypothetical protein